MRSRRRNSNRAVRRIFIVTLAVIILISSNVFIVAVGKLHLRSGTDLSAYAESSNVVTETDQALRGTIYDRNGNVIAEDVRTYNIVCILSSSRLTGTGDAAYVKDKDTTADKLSAVLGIDRQKIYDYLNQDVYQTELGTGGRGLTETIKDEIDDLNLPGIEFTDSVTRSYPNGQFASNLIGYAQTDDSGSTVGKMGLELYLDSYLTGQNGSKTYQVDKDGYVLPGMKETSVSAVNGDDVYLTIDSGIQQSLEDSFKLSASQFDLTSAWGGAMEISTGKVLAWGQTPSFDPNNLSSITSYTNTGTQIPYEAGSTMKTFTWAAAMNEGLYDGTQTTNGNEYCFSGDSNNNPVRSSESDSYGCIYNARHRQHGTVTLDTGLIESLNTVAATIENEVITPEKYLEYLKSFGFFQSVDTDGLPEETGTLNYTWPADKVSLSYGQGSTVTMLQMFQAYSAIFGDGSMKKPYFVDSIRDPYDSSNVVYQGETATTGTPITSDTATEIQALLTRVANDSDGTAKSYEIPECKIMGKTGTSQVASNGSYDTGKVIYSIMAALPADNPQILVYYAYETDYTTDVALTAEAGTAFLRKVAQTYGFTNGDNSAASSGTSSSTSTGYGTTITEMPDLLNHTLDYANGKLSSSGATVVTLGSGSTVINQYPNSGGNVTSGQRVFLLTDSTSFTMPDLTGWTRKDVAALWDVTGFGFELSGTGTVVSQSIPAGTSVTKGTEIKVVFG